MGKSPSDGKKKSKSDAKKKDKSETQVRPGEAPCVAPGVAPGIALRKRQLEENGKYTPKAPKTKEDLWKERKTPVTRKRANDETKPPTEPRDDEKIKTRKILSRIRPPSTLNLTFSKENELLNFEEFVKHGLTPDESDMKKVLQIFDRIKQELEIDPTFATFSTFFPALLQRVNGRLPERSASLLKCLESHGFNHVYDENKAANGKVAVVLGAGPCGLRLAMELQMLGARTIVVEKREQMTRNNVLRLWPFIMEDLKRLGVRKLYPQLEHGSINHISIRMLQLILLKLALLLGVEVRAGESFESLKEPQGKKGWRAVLMSKTELECDMIFCATGANLPEGFVGFSREKTTGFKTAIAVTANFKSGLKNEKNVKEISGLSAQNEMEYFNGLKEKYNIDLENLVYFRDLTNYFVMTVKKDCLLNRGILKKDLDREHLLDPENKDEAALKQFVVEAAAHSTEEKSAKLECSLEDLVDQSIFIFSELYRSKQACRVIERQDHQLLMGLVGDSLMQPFWPKGLGISRGFLSVLDTAWMVKQFYVESEDQDNTMELLVQQKKPKNKVLEVIAEREKLYNLQKTVDDKVQEKNNDKWSIDPSTRYPCNSLTAPYKKNVTKQFDAGA